MNLVDDYNHAMEMVAEVERGPASKFSAETRCFAALVRAVDNYHRETRKKGLRFGDGKQGWTLDYMQVLQVKELAKQLEDVSMEVTEAVMLAMVDAGFARTEKNGR